MNGTLVDTNIASYVAKSHPLAAKYLADLAGNNLYISFVTLAELKFGMEKGNWGSAKRTLINDFLARTKLLGYDDAIMREYIRIRVHRERIGRPLQFEDLWIAATAVAHQLPLVTHNRKDFENIPGLTIISHA